MLLQFKFKNHKCFYDETTLDLTATQEKNHLDTLIDIGGNKLLPLIEINGANASGKTSVLEALQYMIETIKNSNKIDVGTDLITNPYLFSSSKYNENSEYEISIYLNNNEYRYGFSLNKKGFDEEWLYKKKYNKTSISSQKIIFERYKEHINFGKSYEKYNKIWNLFSSQTEINNKKLLILPTIAFKEEEGELRNIYNYILKFKFEIEKYISNRRSINILSQDNKIFKNFEKVINEFDPCLQGISITKFEGNNGEELFKINGIHKNIDSNSKKTLIPLQNESDGTIKMFNIMPSILLNLEEGGILCIDELDVKLHPLLFKKIVSMYKDKRLNKNNAQLIYTAHSTFLFNSENLRRDQLYLTSKDENGMSKLYSLSEFRNLRVDADYEKKYYSGQLGGIPFEER